MNNATELTVNLALPLSAVNYLLQALQDKPYREVSGLVTAITMQAQAQVDAPAPRAAEAAPVTAAPKKVTTGKKRGPKPGARAKKAEAVADAAAAEPTPEALG